MTKKKKLWIIAVAIVVFAALAAGAVALQNALLVEKESGTSLIPMRADLTSSSSSSSISSDADSVSTPDGSESAASNSSQASGTIQSIESSPASQNNAVSQPDSSTSVQPSSDSSLSKPAETVTITFYDNVNQKTLFTGTIPISSESTAGDLTQTILKQNQIKYSITGSGSTIYFAMIGGLREKNAGPMSGWLLFIQEAGKSDYTRSPVGAGHVTLHGGDSALWIYVENSNSIGGNISRP